MKNKVLIFVSIFLVLIVAGGLVFSLMKVDDNIEDKLPVLQDQEEAQTLYYSKKDFNGVAIPMLDDEGNATGDYGVGFSTTNLKANTRYRIKFVVSEEKLSMLTPYLIPKGSGEEVQGYKIFVEPSYQSGVNVTKAFMIEYPSELTTYSFQFVSGQEGDSFVVLPLQVTKTDIDTTPAIMNILFSCFEEVVIQEVK